MTYQRFENLWEPSEEVRLRQLWTEGLLLDEIAPVLGRSKDAIAQRALKLNLPKRVRCDIWTKEDVERFRNLAAEGRSGSQIGQIMGRTRNAILGKAHRLRLALRGPEAQGIRKPKNVPRKDRPYVPRVKPVIETEKPLAALDGSWIPPSPWINLWQLTYLGDTCHFPYGDGPYVFCGQPCLHDDEGNPRVYCRAHWELTHQKYVRNPEKRQYAWVAGRRRPGISL